MEHLPLAPIRSSRFTVGMPYLLIESSRSEPSSATYTWQPTPASLAICLAVGYSLQGSGLIDSGLIVGAALSTTALGALMPILRDANELPTRFGAYATAVNLDARPPISCWRPP